MGDLPWELPPPPRAPPREAELDLELAAFVPPEAPARCDLQAPMGYAMDVREVEMPAMESRLFQDWQLQAKEALIKEALDDMREVQASCEAAERDLEWRKATSLVKKQEIETRQAELSVIQKRVMQQACT